MLGFTVFFLLFILFVFFFFFLEQITVSVLLERTFILGSDAREMTAEAAYCFFQGSDRIYFPTCES